jgi:hypothetical protein
MQQPPQAINLTKHQEVSWLMDASWLFLHQILSLALPNKIMEHLSLSSQVYNIAYKLKRDRKQQSLIHDGNHEKPVVRKAESDYCDAKLPIYGDRFIYPRFLYCCIDLIKWVLLTRSKRVNIGNLFFILIIGHY